MKKSLPVLSNPFQSITNLFRLFLFKKLSSRMNRVYICFAVCATGILFLGNASGPASAGNGGNTGAPGDGTCNDCHGGGSFNPAIVIQVFQNGTTTPATSYIGGTTYDLKVTVSSSTGSPRFGFQITALKSNNTKAGTFNTPGTGTHISAFGGRSYLEHSTPSTTGIFKSKWVAPVAGTGIVTFYSFGNCVNFNGATNGDNPTGTSLDLPEANLPVKVSDFQVKAESFGNRLSWISNNEINNAYFNIQHSNDAKNFTTIGKVSSQAVNGNSNIDLKYSFTDEKPIDGQNYYRLQQVNLDGTVSFISDVKSIAVNADATTVSYYPNPVKNILYINVSTTNKTIVKLIDFNGNTVRQIRSLPLQDKANFKMDIHQLHKGMYVLQVFENGKITSVKEVLKQ